MEPKEVTELERARQMNHRHINLTFRTEITTDDIPDAALLGYLKKRSLSELSQRRTEIIDDEGRGQ
jgi:hypothetical protein